MILTIIIKTILITSLATIFYQDIKAREVWWFLFPAFGMSAGFLYFDKTIGSVFLASICYNFIILSILVGISFLYVQLKMKLNFFKEAFGAGDLLFFIGLATGFPTTTFVILFVFSLIFSLCIHSIISLRKTQATVPLAGYMSVFLMLTYFSNWTTIFNNLYYH